MGKLSPNLKLYTVVGGIELKCKQYTRNMYVWIQNLCKGGPSEILPTLRSGVAAVKKNVGLKIGGRGGGAAPLAPLPPLDPHIRT